MKPKQYALDYKGQKQPMSKPAGPIIAIACEGYLFLAKTPYGYQVVYGLSTSHYGGINPFDLAADEFHENLQHNHASSQPLAMKPKQSHPPKLTPSQARHIFHLYHNTKETISSLALLYQVSQTTIRRVLDRKPPYQSTTDYTK